MKTCLENLVTTCKREATAMKNGDTRWYVRKVCTHVDAGNENKVMLYICIYYSFHEINTDDYGIFKFAFNFLKTRGITAKIKPGIKVSDDNEEHKYRQIVFFRNNNPIHTSHYPNGYVHYFEKR